MSAALALALALAALPSGGGQVEARAPAGELPWSSLEREASVRTWAHDPASHGEAITAALDASLGGGATPWTRRSAALEALRRAVEVGALGEEAGAATGERAELGAALARELERAVAAAGAAARAGTPALDRSLDQVLALAAVWPGELALDREGLEAAARHPSPAVRLALARCLGRPAPAHVRPAGGAGGGSWSALAAGLLAGLGADPDPRVGLEARRVLVADPALLAALGRAGGEVRDAALVLPAAGPSGAGGEALGSTGSAGSGGSGGTGRGAGQGAGVALGLSADLLERARVPAACLSDTSPQGLALAVRLHASAPAARRLAAVWERVVDPGERELLLRAARVARAEGLPLADGLRARLEAPPGDRPGPEAARWMLEGLLTAGDPAQLAPELAPDLAAQAFGLLIGRELDWNLERTRPLLDPLLSPRDLRLRVLMTLASVRTRGPDDPTEQLLALGLEDPDPAAVEVAFRALASAPRPEAWMEALHRAWLALDAGERARFLRHLPRAPAPLPFRDELLALAGDEAVAPAARASALELLASFEGDAEVAGAIEAWLEQELARLSAAASDDPAGSQGPQRLSELRCTGLVRALHHLEGQRAVPALVDVLGAPGVLGPGPGSQDVAKVTATALGATAEGRAELARWLASPDAAPGRARVEAAVQLVGHGSEEAVAVLEAAYPGCEWELRGRILKALGAPAAPSASRPERARGAALGLLEAVAADRDEEWELRTLALEGLARRAPREQAAEVLLARFAATDELELARVLVELLGELGGEAPRAFLERRLERLEALPLEDGGTPELERARNEREAVLVALGRAALSPDAPPPEGLVRAWLRLPGAAAAGELEARFVGRKLATTSFRYGAELDLAELLARAGAAAGALEASGPWWTLDARFLASLGERLAAGGDRASARAAWRAALVGLAGEGEAPDRPSLELRLRGRLMGAAAEAGAWGELAGLAALVLRDWRTLATPEHAFSAELGDFDPARGRDPEARLESLLLQARARAALERGDVALARMRADRAAEAVGHSSAARASQQALERDLAR